jgi:L-fuconolactonase
LEESRWLLELADRNPLIRGVVGWVDLCSERVGEQLASLAGHPKFVGVRHVVQDEPDDRFMGRANFRDGLARLRKCRLTYDILIFPKQLPAAIDLVEAFPDQPFVLDHLAKPCIRDGTISPWKERMRELAQAPHVMAKVSGLVTEANWGSWRADDFKPYLDHAFECFGVERLMYGSDWPVCLLAGSYEAVHGLMANYVKSFSADERAGFFGGNAARFYGV